MFSLKSKVAEALRDLKDNDYELTAEIMEVLEISTSMCTKIMQIPKDHRREILKDYVQFLERSLEDCVV